MWDLLRQQSRERTAVWGFWVAWGCLAVSCAPSAEPPSGDPSLPELPVFAPEDFEIELGLGGVHPDAARTQLRLRLGNTGADFDGTVLVRGILASTPGAVPVFDPLVYRVELELPRNTDRELAFDVAASAWQEVQVDLRQGEFHTIMRAPSNPLRKQPIAALLVGESTPALPGIERIIDRCFANFAEGTRSANTSSFQFLEPSKLAQQSSGYDGFTAVILWGTNLAETPPERLAELEEWVRRGGTLLVFPGPEWSSGVAPRLLELAGVEPLPREGAQAQALAESLGATEFEIHLTPLSQRGATAHENGFVFERRLGCGLVTTLAVTPVDRLPDPGRALQPPLDAWVRRAVLRGLSVAAAPEPVLQAWDSTALQTLYSRSTVRHPPASAIGRVLLGYLGCGLVLPLVLFRRRSRREWVFVWVLGVAVLMNFGVYRYGLATFGQEAQLEEISFARLHANGAGAEITSFVSFTSPQRDLVSPQSGRAPSAEGPLGLALVRTLRSQRWDLAQQPELSRRSEVVVDRNGRARFQRVPLRPNSPEVFRVDYSLPQQSIVAVERTRDGRSIRLTNRTDKPLIILTSFRGHYGRQENLGAGQTIEVGHKSRERDWNWEEWRRRPGAAQQLDGWHWEGALADALAWWNYDEERGGFTGTSPLLASYRKELPDNIVVLAREALYPLALEDYEHNGRSILLIEFPQPR